MRAHERIDYVELPAADLAATAAFFKRAFGWSFQDYGPDYVAFSDAGLEGGFYRSERKATVEGGSALVVLYSRSLEATRDTVVEAGGTVVRDIFAFPGGRRFHFVEPSGNELAVWSDDPEPGAETTAP